MFLPVTASKVLLLENFVRPTRGTATGLRTEYATNSGQ
jgi:hypothetical protein